MSDLTRRGFVAATIAAVIAGDRPLALLQALVRSDALFDAPRDVVAAIDDPSLDRRRAALEVLLKVYGQPDGRMINRFSAVDKTWAAWQERTGELPPDFDMMPSDGMLPDPLIAMRDGRPHRITSASQWRARREELKQQFRQWVLGEPYPTPTNLRGVVTDTKRDGDITVQSVRIEFGEEYKATLRVELLIPPGTGPFPTFITNHRRNRPWANTAVRRGYLTVGYQAIDPLYGVRDDTAAWVDLYPNHVMSALGRWSWACSRVIDYLVTLPIVDKDRIATGGHSRNAKQALFAAAFDERIGAVAPSRGNNGSEIAWRHSSAPYLSEPISELTGHFPDWYHPRLRFFVGREHKLPVDQNQMLALVAPRGLLLSHAYHEHQGNAWGIEQSYRSAKSVYRLLGKEHNIGLYQVPGEHPSTAEDVEKYFDFFDTVFERKRFAPIENWVHGYTFEGWRQRSREKIDPMRFPERTLGDFFRKDGAPIATPEVWAARKEELRTQHQWAYGEEPHAVTYPAGVQGGTTTSNNWLDDFFGRPVKGGNSLQIAFGDDLRADLYLAKGLATNRAGRTAMGDKKWPVIMWMHPYSYATGYSQYPTFWQYFLDIGINVIAFDQIGFGVRNLQALEFYRRYPKWSLLGKMIADTRAAITQVLTVPYIDKVYLMGYSLGAKLALHVAAADERVAGVAAVCPFAPLRTPREGTEGIQHYSHLHGLLPRLGSFLQHPSRIPIDYDELIARVAPQPVMIVSPSLDRNAPVEDVRASVESARSAYTLLGAADKLVLETPLAFDEFQAPPYAWLDGLMSSRPPIPEIPVTPPRPTTPPPVRTDTTSGAFHGR